MEQNVNTFLKGLQMDVNPMVQGNDVLSDALNATLVTMNGNEVILLNDMGNRRIDNAYLPPGYEPVGIKEYGGVIYVAAYNPLTNMSLVGSFPSPERKINVLDDPSLGNDLDFSKFEGIIDENVPAIKVDTLLIPLTANNSLHIGDKFVVYSEDLSNTNISNWENISGDKVNSPKNKCYTLALGILNSLNEFVDITKSLVRWNGNSIIKEDLKDKSDLYKFNKGYFIAKSLNNTCKEYTENDSNLIKERQTIAANTYAYKLVGPLYLKATLNHILEFNYNIYGNITKIENNVPAECDIIIEGYITYNCPDNINTGSLGDENYKYYNIGEIEKWPYTFVLGPKNEVKYSIEEQNGPTVSIEGLHTTSYNPETNLYLVKLVKKHHYSTLLGYTEYGYALGVIALVDDKKLIIPSLSVKGVIDLSKLGSGQIELKGWRFYNYENKTKLTYNFEAYPKYGERFTNLTMKFTEVNPSPEGTLHTFTLENQPIYNGKNTIEIDWEKEGVKPRTLYLVEITYSTEPIILPEENVISSRGINRDTSTSDQEENIGNNARRGPEGPNLDSWEPIDPTKFDDDEEEEKEENEKEKEIIPPESWEGWLAAGSSSIIWDVVPVVKVGQSNENNTITFYRWFLSTPLLNDCYNPSSQLFIKDYGIPNSDELEILKIKLLILPSINFNIIDKSYLKEQEEIHEGEIGLGWFRLKTNNNDPDPIIYLQYLYQHKLDLTFEPFTKILNYNLYPKWTTVNFSEKPKFKIASDKNAKQLLDLINIKGSHYSEGVTTKELKDDENMLMTGINRGNVGWVVRDLINQENYLSLDGNKYEKEIWNLDFIYGKSNSNGTLKNAFGPAINPSPSQLTLNSSIDGDYFLKSIYGENDLTLPIHIVLGTTFHHSGGGAFFGSEDTKYYKYLEHSDFKFNLDESESGNFSKESDDEVIFPLNDELTLATKDFLSGINTNSVISYFFDYYPDSDKGRSPDVSRTSILSTTRESNRDYLSSSRNARLFWRKNNGYWTVLDTLITTNTPILSGTTELTIVNNGLLDLIRKAIKKDIFKNLDITYCFSDEVLFSDLKLYHISDNPNNYRYNEPYSIDLLYNIIMTAKCTALKHLTIEVKKFTGNMASFNSEELNALNNSSYKFFESNNNIEYSSKLNYNIKLESNEQFHNKISSMLSGEFSNMDMYGNTSTIDGKDLNKNKLYIFNNTNKTIVKEAELLNYKITPEFGITGYNTIVYTGNNPALLSKPYDVNYGDLHSHGAVDYSKLELYKPVM